MGPTLHCHTEGGYGPAPWASSSSIEAQLGHGLSPWPGVHHPTITEGAQRKQYAPKEPKKKRHLKNRKQFLSWKPNPVQYTSVNSYFDVEN